MAFLASAPALLSWVRRGQGSPGIWGNWQSWEEKLFHFQTERLLSASPTLSPPAPCGTMDCASFPFALLSPSPWGLCRTEL